MSKELLNAINAKNWKVAEDLIQTGADLTTVDEKGNTALHLAVIHSHTSTVRLLLAKGANIHAINKIGETPLHYIDKSSWIDPETSVIFELMVNQGADLTLRDHRGCISWYGITNMLVYAHEVQDIEFIKSFTLLLSKGVNVNTVIHNGETFLHRAANLDRPWVVRFLLEHGADVNAKTEGKTALLLAAESASRDIFPLLGGADADINAKTPDQKTVLHCILKNEIEEEECILEGVDSLLELGADINAVDQDNNTPLHLAAMRFSQGNEHEIISLWYFLIRNGANVDAVNHKGETPSYIYNQRLGYMPGGVAAATAAGIPPATEVWEAQASDFPLHQDAEENRQPVGAGERPGKKARVQVRPDYLKFGAYTEADIELITNYYDKLQQAPKTPHTEFVLASMESIRCKYTLGFPKYPVLLLADGYTYEREDVNRWVTEKMRSPSNHAILCTPHDIVDNRAARESMDSFIRMAKADKLAENQAMEVKRAAEANQTPAIANQSSGLLFSLSMLPSDSSPASSSPSAFAHSSSAYAASSSSSAFAVNSTSSIASNSVAGHLAEPMVELDEEAAAGPSTHSHKRPRSESF